MLFLRALFAFLALPSIVGGVVPGLILRNDHSRAAGTPLGWPLVLFGASVLLWCVRDFYVIGKGTLAPWDPSEEARDRWTLPPRAQPDLHRGRRICSWLERYRRLPAHGRVCSRAGRWLSPARRLL